VTEQERLMIVAAAREIRDGEVVFVGMRRPMLAFALAQRLHAPNAVALYEIGVARAQPTRSPLTTMGDLAILAGAAWAGSLTTLMGLMAQGHVALGMLGGAQLDRYGNLNTSYIGPYAAPERRLPGSGGGSDIASLAQRLLVMMPHEPRRFVEEVDFITSPGHGTGHRWREGVGLPTRGGPRPYGGPDAVVTDLAVLRFDEEGEMMLMQTHPGVSVAEVQARTGWPLRVSDDVTETAPPSDEERSTLNDVMAA
jgi:glutaconate CoA-transferase subunit B